MLYKILGFILLLPLIGLLALPFFINYLDKNIPARLFKLNPYLVGGFVITLTYLGMCLLTK